MHGNPAINSSALVAWTGTAAIPRNITTHTRFAFQIEVQTTLSAPAVFNVVAYDALPTNPCAHDPASATPVLDIGKCYGLQSSPAPAAAVVTIPAGTAAGSICSFVPRCAGKKFVGLVAVSGAANTLGTIVQTGRK